MPSQLVQIADGLVSILDAADLTPDPTVERLYVPKFSAMSSGNGVSILVVTLGQQIADSSRAVDAFTYQLQIAVRKRVAATEGQEIDDLIEFTEKVIDVIRQNKEVGQARLVSIANEASYNAEWLAEQQTFFSVIKGEYRLLR